MNPKQRNKFKNSQTYTYKRKYPNSPKKKTNGKFWIRLLEGIGWIFFIGMLLLYWDSSRLISIIIHSKPVTQLSADMTGIVRLEGVAISETAVTDEGTLRQKYAMLQKEPFRWECSRSGCEYKLNDSLNPKIWGGLTVNGLDIQAERYHFYTNWLPLNIETVESDHLFRIYEGGSSRPLLVEKSKSTAYGYYAVSSGDWITVIGQAKNGRLEPFAFPGNEDMQPVILIGDSLERMVSKEKGIRTAYMVVGIFVMLLLLPKTIGRIRHVYGKLIARNKRGKP